MADIFPGAPKPSLLNQELSLNQQGLNDVAKTVNREIRNQEAQDQRRRSLSFNGTSYSGVDIKVLVSKYGTPSGDLRADIERAIAAYNSIATQLETLTTVVFELSIARTTPTTGVYAQVLARYRGIIQSISSTEGLIKDTGFMQFISNTLNNRLIDAQRNPQLFNDEIAKTLQFLESLLSGWRQQAAALQSRTSEMVNTKVLAELQTISISSFREKSPVRALGNAGVKGYTRGTRTVAGSMIFTVFDRNVLFSLLESSHFDADDNFRSAIKDQLPPIDITILFANEAGALSRMGLYGVEFVSEAQTMSIEDIILEDVCQFVARDVDPMTPVLNDRGETYNTVLLNYNQAVAQGRGDNARTDLRASDLKGSQFDLQPNETNSAIRRFRNRSNPFF